MDRLRQGVFSSLGELVEGSRFLDLFAGTGSYGLEAFSRGASGGIFVDRDRRAIAAIEANASAVCRSLGVKGADLQTILCDVARWKPPTNERVALIFVDPPFSDISRLAPELFPRLRDWLESSGVLVFQVPGEMEPAAPGWNLLRRIGKGRRQPTCCIYRPE